MTLWKFQLPATQHIVASPATLLDAPMGSGKSKIIVDAIRESGLDLVLILCPAQVIGVWRRETAKWGLDHQTICLDQRTAALKAHELWNITSNTIVVVSYDSSRSKTLLPELLKYHWQFIIADESHRLKNGDSKTCHAACRLAEHSVKRVAATGTVCPNNPLDIFGQFRFLDASILGSNFFRLCQRIRCP
jgi:SNF2 family DNA or RNA helicase